MYHWLIQVCRIRRFLLCRIYGFWYTIVQSKGHQVWQYSRATNTQITVMLLYKLMMSWRVPIPKLPGPTPWSIYSFQSAHLTMVYPVCLQILALDVWFNTAFTIQFAFISTVTFIVWTRLVQVGRPARTNKPNPSGNPAMNLYIMSRSANFKRAPKFNTTEQKSSLR
jgi:hypothetical protein